MSSRNESIETKEYLKIWDAYLVFQKTIEAEREEYRKNKYIQTGKVPHENFSFDLLPKALQGDDALLFMPLILNLDKANELLKESYGICLSIQENTAEIKCFNSYYYNKLRLNSVMIIHIMKHFIDMMIIYLLNEKFKVENAKRIDCIGKWLGYADKPDVLKPLDKDNKEFFEKINSIDNANKHHVKSVYEAYRIGRDEFVCFAFNEREGKPYAVAAESLVKKFNSFYQDVLNLCR